MVVGTITFCIVFLPHLQWLFFSFPQDYELQLIAYKAQVEPLTSPLKKTKMDSASDNIIQEVSLHLKDVFSEESITLYYW